MDKNVKVRGSKLKDVAIIALITVSLIGAYLVYVTQATKEIPFIYNQF